MSDLGNKKVFAKNLNYYMKINNIDRNKICKDLDFNYTTVREWTNGTSYPRIDKIEMLANYFGILKSDLIENKSKDSAFDELDILFSKHKDVLSESDKNIIKSIILERKKEIDKELNNE